MCILLPAYTVSALWYWRPNLSESSAALSGSARRVRMNPLDCSSSPPCYVGLPVECFCNIAGVHSATKTTPRTLLGMLRMLHNRFLRRWVEEKLHPPLTSERRRSKDEHHLPPPPDPPPKLCVQLRKFSSTKEGVHFFFHSPGGCAIATSMTRGLERKHQKLRRGDRGMVRYSFRAFLRVILLLHGGCNFFSTHRLIAPE